MSTAILASSASPDRLAIPPLALPVCAVLGVLAGLLLSAGYALHPLWWTPWLAPVPLLFAGARSWRRALVVGGFAGIATMASLFAYVLKQNGWVVLSLVVLLRVGAWTLATQLAGAAARRMPLGLAMLVLPAVAAAIELLVMTYSVHGASGSLAYSQMNMPALIQVAALGGVPALVFLILLPGSFLGLWLSQGRPRRQGLSALAVLAVAGLALTAFSAARLAAPASGHQIRATMIATDKYQVIPTDWQAVWATYRPSVLATAKAGELVVLPEKIALLDTAGAAGATRDIVAAARATGAVVVVGLEVRDGRTYRNRSLVAAPDGHTAWYDKQRMVPGWEARDIPGKTPLVMDALGARLGIAICKDMHIPSIGREYAGDAGIMAIPAWDFGFDDWMGARMTALRAVENGYAIARSARDGYVGGYDRTGRVIAERRTSEGLTIARASLPTGGGETVYGRIGDLFGWACLGAVALLMAWLGLVRRRTPRAVPG
jgi:apolipoprotein N-acyltransferase